MELKDLVIKLKGLVEGSLNKADFQEIGEKVKKTVVNRTLKGFGVAENNSSQKRLKGLKNSYKKQRRRLKRQRKLSSNTTPTKSNLTQSGKMLEDVKVRATNNSTTVFLGSAESNKKAINQSNDDRHFMALSKSEIRQIKKEIEQKIINDIKKKGL